MDLVKIGKYIAGKRKALGLTQAQVAEKLGMSDKSVSKWERGICLPDVSVYMELCEILGISLNEFIAGEDLPQENIIKQSEKNLIRVTEDGNIKRKKLRKIIAVLLCLTLLVSTALCSVIFMRGMPVTMWNRWQRTVRRWRWHSFYPERTVPSCINTGWTTRLQKSRSHCPHIRRVFFRRRKSWEEWGCFRKSWEGMAAFIPDFEHFKIRVILTGDGTKYETEFDILKIYLTGNIWADQR